MINSLYIASAGSVALDIREDGKITGITIVGVDALNGGAEVSFIAGPHLSTHDAIGVLAGVIYAGAGNPLVHRVELDEPVQAGERLYLHVAGAGNATRAFIHSDARSTRPARVRR